MQKYKIGDYVMYGISGACEIVEIGPLDFGGADTVYYSLRPVYDDRDTIFVPVTRDEEISRKVIGRKRAREVLDLIKARVDELSASDDKMDYDRESWDGILKTSEHEGVISMILQLRDIRRENKKNHKSLNIADAKLLTYAERILYSEMAVALGMTMDDAYHKIDVMLCVPEAQ